MGMEEIYEEATRGLDVPEATANRVWRLVRDAWNIQITRHTHEVSVEAVPEELIGTLRVIGRFHRMLEGQNFVWAWLTGPYGVVKDVRFVKTGSNTFGIDLGALVIGIRDYLTNRSA